jgi:hypothetical protein
VTDAARPAPLTLFGKERRELVASRAALLVALALGPLVGQAFVTAVETYAEASGVAGGPAALAQGLSPLDGLVVPTFGAYALVATLLFPFVAIRLASAEKESGALGLLLQAPASAAAQTLVKFATLCAAWIVGWVPGLAALALWRAYGGHLHAPEVVAVLAGHLLRGALVAAVGLAAAAIADGAASAAVVTLAVTLGAWALDFIGQVKGGALLAAARFTPEAALRTFERGEPRLDVALVTLAMIAALLALAVVWQHPGRPRRVRVVATLAIAAATLGIVPLAARARPSRDLSEDRRNSLPPADARALATLPVPLVVEAHLAPEDPRLADLRRGVLHKLERAVPAIRVTTVARTSTGLFEPPDGHYGEVWYALGDRRVMSRSTTEPIVLETIYQLAGRTPPAPDAEVAYPGYPLRATPRWAAALFYAVWPLMVLLLWWAGRRDAPARPVRTSD